MPLVKCMKNGQSGWKYGQNNNSCFTGPQGKKMAIKQGIAIDGPSKFKQEMSKGENISEEEFEQAVAELIESGEIDRYDYYVQAAIEDTEEFSYSYVSVEERKSIPLSEFGLPSERKYPADTLAHFKAACKLYGRAPKDKQATIKRNLIRIGRAKGFPIPAAWTKNDDNK